MKAYHSASFPLNLSRGRMVLGAIALLLATVVPAWGQLTITTPEGTPPARTGETITSEETSTGEFDPGTLTSGAFSEEPPLSAAPIGEVAPLPGNPAGQSPNSQPGDGLDSNERSFSGSSVTPIDPADADARNLDDSGTAAPELAADPVAPAPDDTASADGDLQPIPDSIDGAPVAIEVASFKGVTPGLTTTAELEQAWGAPREMTKRDGELVHLYSVEPFENVDVSSVDGKVVSVVIRLDRVFPARAVAEQLELTRVAPALVHDGEGNVLGQVYPERGVLFAFEPSGVPGRPSMQVSQIILEPIRGEAFVLRAEETLDEQPARGRRDLELAVELDPTNARAQWLLGQVLARAGEYDKALAAAGSAVTHAPNDPQFQITRAKLLGQVGRLKEGIAAAKRAATLAADQPRLQARALCMLGDLQASGASPDYGSALKSHMAAIRVADSVAGVEQRSLRLEAKETLVDAHLGAAHDIAWGEWKDKESAVTKWLARAARVADEVVEKEEGDSELRFRVATRALAACVGAHGKIDPDRWTQQALKTGNQLIEQAEVPARRASLQWDLGMALYDALQVYQMRSEHDTALQHGEQAIAYLEEGNAVQQLPTASYLIGRLYFRLGAIHAIRDDNHRVAIAWFEKALPHLEKKIPAEAFADLGRHGETFVSMGVSYWETGQREKAIELTQRGAALMKRAVERGTLEPKALQVPFANLASMHRSVGAEDKAKQFEQMANRPDGPTLK